MINNRDLKKNAVKVLYDNYGFAPTALKDIILLEADNKTGQFIRFQVGSYIYSWDSVTLVKSSANDLSSSKDKDTVDGYYNIETGDIATVIDINDKYKTVMIEYSNGRTRSLALSMFKKLWKPINKKEEN